MLPLIEVAEDAVGATGAATGATTDAATGAATGAATEEDMDGALSCVYDVCAQCWTGVFVERYGDCNEWISNWDVPPCCCC